ncbi:hypothetical protein [Brotaphodocola sp.]|uniref:hypothetical protein n=1 Tax=Brotaphodocola sp. TaxID=3073577 RepID=UPI003D7D39FF
MGMNWKRVAIVTAMLSVTVSGTAFAGWTKKIENNQEKWKYDSGNGVYLNNGWQWIDDNKDGIAESYYFDSNGYLLTDTTTPDGYAVNKDGAWVLNGVIQTKNVVVNAEPITEKDFIISGDNSVTKNNADNSIITNWKRLGFNDGPYHVFVTGDSLVTSRGIVLGDSKDAVIEKYGSADASKFSTADRWYQLMIFNGQDKTTDGTTIASASSVMNYYSDPYGIQFYFNQDDQIIGIVYYRLD